MELNPRLRWSTDKAPGPSVSERRDREIAQPGACGGVSDSRLAKARARSPVASGHEFVPISDPDGAPHPSPDRLTRPAGETASPSRLD